ncbi:MAG: hypothetical protein OXH38_09390 [Chloroflexi bacterium]|nr:hypothetical protein [Chloroflexota bacterium]
MVTAVTPGLAAPHNCTHVWVIDSPHGASSLGRCARCDSHREFLNSIPEERRANNSDLFTQRRPGERESWSDDDIDSALRSMRVQR